MGRLVTDVWKKSFLLEFEKTDGRSTLFDCFTFSLPPESAEIKYSFRKTETKTFGGLHVDDYGIDAVKISLSGTTGNSQLKRIYRPGSSDLWLSGEDEIYYLESKLKEFKGSKDKIEKKIMLYDLSKFEYNLANGSVAKRATKNYWQVFIDSFVIKRAKDRPFVFEYAIDFTGVDPQRSNTAAENSLLENVLTKLADAKSKVEEIAGVITDGVQSVNEKIERFNAAVDSVADAYTDLITTMHEQTEDAVQAVTETAAAIQSPFETVLSAIQETASVGQKFQRTALYLWSCTAVMADEIRNIADVKNMAVKPETLELYGVTAAEFHDVTNLMLGDIENDAAAVVAAAKSNIGWTAE